MQCGLYCFVDGSVSAPHLFNLLTLELVGKVLNLTGYRVSHLAKHKGKATKELLIFAFVHMFWFPHRS